MFRRSSCLKPWADYEIVNEITGFSLHEKQLIPCYLIDQNNFKVNLMKPLPGVVNESVSRNVFPGGSLTAGYDSFWNYLFLTKPKLIIQDFKERFGFANGRVSVSSALEDYYINMFELNSLLDLANKNNFQLILIDPENAYKQIILNNELKNISNLLYIDKDFWSMHVVEKSIGMSSNDKLVPMDGHFGKGIN